MFSAILVTVLAALLLIVAALGTVYPVLPGSGLAIVTLIVWALVMSSWPAWVAAAVGVVLAAIGWASSAILTGRTLKEQQIPRASTLVAVVAGIVGMFVFPVFGLFIGFVLGLLVSEFVRRGDPQVALASSLAALRAMGVGVLLEFSLVCLAGSVWTVGMIVHFVTR